jgi:hypothetical protein
MNADQPSAWGQDLWEDFEERPEKEVKRQDQIPRTSGERDFLKIDSERLDGDKTLGRTSTGNVEGDIRNIGQRDVEALLGEPDRVPSCSAGDIDSSAFLWQKVNQLGENSRWFARGVVALKVPCVPTIAIRFSHFVLQAQPALG